MKYDLLKSSAVGLAVAAFFVTLIVLMLVGLSRLAIVVPLLFGVLAGSLYSIAELLERREQERTHVWRKHED